MTHDDAKAQIAALFEGDQGAVRREPLRDHLKACDGCRGFYDQTALTLRRMLGRPDEMAPEELWLFQPPLPAAEVVPLPLGRTGLLRTGRAAGFAIAAMLAAVVLWYSGAKNDEFGARGGPAVAVRPSLRVVCLRGEVVSPTCTGGDTVLFAVTPNGAPHVKLVADGVVLGEGDVADAPGTVLPWSVPWRAGTKFMAEFSCAGCTTVSVTPTP